MRALIDQKAETALVMANRLLAHISRLLNYALEHECIDANPAARLSRPGDERRRDRVLTPDELRAVWTALGETGALSLDGEPVLDADGEPFPRLSATLNDTFRVLLLTGQRLGEVSRMRWADVDLDKS